MSSQLHWALWLIHWQAFAGDEGVLARRDIVKSRQEQGNIVQLQCGLSILFALLKTWPTVFHSINSPRLYLVYMYDDNPLGREAVLCSAGVKQQEIHELILAKRRRRQEPWGEFCSSWVKGNWLGIDEFLINCWHGDYVWSTNTAWRGWQKSDMSGMPSEIHWTALPLL